jgi:putative phosphoesterase
MPVRLGLISDTHGLLREEAVLALRGCELILHGGDIGGPEILQALQDLAPTRAVRGNNDKAAWAAGLPLTDAIECAGLWFYLLHDLADLDLDPAAAGFAAVVSGHSHQPQIAWRQGVLFLNPGSAGPRRFKLPVSLALVDIEAGELWPRIECLA